MKKVLMELDLDWIGAVIDAGEYVRKLKEYLKSDHNPQSQIDTDAISDMLQITESLSQIQNAIYRMSRRSICSITVSILDNYKF